MALERLWTFVVLGLRSGEAPGATRNDYYWAVAADAAAVQIEKR